MADAAKPYRVRTMTADSGRVQPGEQAQRAERFLDLHRTRRPLLMPNPWDVGSARLFASLGFEALATTSSGFAATLGRLDGSVTRDEALAHSAAIAAATALPVSADLENGFGDSPDEVAATAAGAVAAGLSGFSIEDYSGNESDTIYEISLAAERIAAAAEVAHQGSAHVVLTARSENLIRGHDDLDDTIARLRAFQDAGADVLFAPGLTSAEQIQAVLAAVDRPVNVLVRPGAPTIAELGALGVSRISVGGSFAFAAIAAVADAATELRDEGTYGYASAAGQGIKAARQAFQ
jgi:2-methylisocitrate lyase-like PEP mutase family enzyme